MSTIRHTMGGRFNLFVMQHPRLEFTRDRAHDSFKRLRARVFERLRSEATSTAAGPKLWLQGAGLGLVAGGAYISLLTFSPNGVVALALGATCGVATLLFALNVSHDAAHGSFSRYAHVNDALLFVSFAILGVDPGMWRARHLRSHHRFPNVDACDADIDENPFLRLSPYQPRRRWHRFQHIYAWPLYFVVATHAAWLQDLNYMRRVSLANMHDWPLRVPSWPRFLATKLVHVTLVYALPLWLCPAPWFLVLAGLFFIQGLVSLLFILPLIGTHFSSAATFPENLGGRMDHSYVTHQILTSVDWSPESRLACGLLGGLNAHVAHHLFPNVSHRHYHWISKEIAKFCVENDLNHNVVTLPRAIRNHYEFLRDLA